MTGWRISHCANKTLAQRKVQIVDASKWKVLTTNHWGAGCHEAVSFLSNIICITQIDFTSLVSVHSYRLQKFQVSSQSSAVYKPYPPPPMPCIFSTWEGTVMHRLCFTYGDFKKCCTYFNTMSTYAPLPCSHYIRPWFPCFVDKFEKTRLDFQGLIQDSPLAMHKLTFVVQWSLYIKFARVQRKSFLQLAIQASWS